MNQKHFDQIIVNRMYIGSYLDSGDNIGHEIINLFQPDKDDKTYIWLNSQGTIPPKYADPKKTRAMIMARFHHKGVWEIIGKAENLTSLPGTALGGKTASTIERRHRIQRKKLYDKLVYGGAHLFGIMSGNSFQGKNTNQAQVNEQDIVASYAADNLFVPADGFHLFLRVNTDKATRAKQPFMVEVVGPGLSSPRIDVNEETDRDDGRVKEKGLANESLRMFFDAEKRKRKKGEKSSKYAYETLLALINEKRYWQKHEEKVQAPTALTLKETHFLETAGDEDRELAFSNVMAYFLRMEGASRRFIGALAKKETTLAGFEDDEYEVLREENDIDLLLRGKNHLIVIENKIKSNINGKSVSFDAQLNKIFGQGNSSREKKRLIKEAAEAGAGLIPTQLSKYYAYAMKAIWEMQKNPSDASFLLFCPDYQNYFINETNLKALLFGAHYRIVLYSTVLEAFEDAFPKDKLGLPDSSYFHDFVLALRKHAREKDDYYETEIKKRFFDAIYRIEHP